ncbi:MULTISPECIES: malonate decarboxylase subunit delta [Rahnella]|jgi:malonate decarboxylase delta subunit|uniref:Malonate decarboxylase acyl carrier protein n=1 Tax=Rahnella victoriana TaxID=1510570 RepID=A0ABS0DTI1_9GAMM|nr:MULTISPECIES: malonate decarboxylase subunit delta [Rahnella]VTQ56702.1 Malonate decarboxylase subunit delta [Campylobacter jejuni]MBF7957198.1 malonate decarboxylase subunit delta [Rahnella victoriana]PBI80928.1 malonate decarboxylase acyl carrier protein [Rahnella victoriana]TBX34144.1 malonate decarboxylase subunit delta [Rahnella victoriana]TDS93214.1 malonate decarboxylase delta subunit [Rahnella sp. BIGb0236]
MERFEFSYPAAKPLADHAQAGVVGSGDLEALYEPQTTRALNITVTTSVDGSHSLWQHFFDRLNALRELPAGRLDINDFGATPGVARLRIEQVFEEAEHAN